MKQESTMLLVGIGGAGCRIVSEVRKRFGEDIRHVLVDTDSKSFSGDSPFLLLGPERLSGRSAAMDISSAHLAAEDSVAKLDEFVTGVRIAVIATGLGGGTGSGATPDVVKHLASRGIVSIVIATTPFAFEGELKHRNARSGSSMIADAANACFLMPSDHLAGGCDEMDAAMRTCFDSLSAAITLFWRIIESPGYIRLDAERLRLIAQNAGRGRFATACVAGPDRARRALDELTSSPLLAGDKNSVRSILCGVLAGEDLRLSEIACVADGLKTSFGGDKCDFELATVNDEKTFGGRLCVVAMMFELPARREDGNAKPRTSRKAKAAAASRNALAVSSRFTNVEPTIWNDENLDFPTYLRQNITLEF